MRPAVCLFCCMLAAGCSDTSTPVRPAASGKVPVADGVSYSLEDAEERHRSNPDSFSMPTLAARESLEPGQIVKLLFAITVAGEEQVERMWVVIQRREGADYIGELDNHPASTDKMTPGLVIQFQAKHVIDIHPKRVPK